MSVSSVPRHRDKDVEEYYEIGAELGKGSFATVRKVRHKATGVQWAAKIIETDGLDEKAWAMIETEIQVLQRMNHPNVIKCNEIFEIAGKEIYLIVELVTGGELFDKIVELKSYSEQDASKVIRQVTDAIQAFHKLRVIHRDLKPENLLLSSDAVNADIKLADFGLSHIFDDEKPIRTAVGTPGYIAPEVLLTLDDPDLSYGPECDLFSIGVILYILLCGFPPFFSDDDDECFDLTIAGDYTFPSPYWDNVSADAKDLIERLLKTDPQRRATCREVLEHPWIVNPMRTDHMSNAQVEMKRWRARRRWKMGINTVIALRKFNFGKPLVRKKKSERHAPKSPAPPKA